jgi:hypothetical protein
MTVYIQALKKFNEGKKYTIPKKGTDDYNSVMQIITSPALAPVHRWIGLLRREYSEPPRGFEPHSHPLTEGSKGCGACQATLL